MVYKYNKQYCVIIFNIAVCCVYVMVELLWKWLLCSKIGEEQIFYFLQRGISIEKAIELMISGFCREVFTELPLEFAAEADRLLTLKLEGSVG